MSRYATVALAVLLVAGALASPIAGGAGHDAGTGYDVGDVHRDDADGTEVPTAGEHPTITAVYPNPVADGDRGEFVVLAVPAATELGTYRIADEQDSLGLPNATVEGSIALTPDPRAVRNLTDRRVLGLDDDLALANGGETVELRHDNETVSTARYRDAPEGDLARYDRNRTVEWQPLGATDRRVVAADGGRVRAFVLPDSPDVPLEFVESADERLYLAGYTFSSDRIAASLERAADRGVDVRVLLEGGPVGGISRRQAATLDDLAASGVTVEVIGGPRARYAYHHAKYAVADDRALVATENWKPSGVGGQSSRGWGAIVSQPEIVAGLAETFRADAGWRDTRPWGEHRRGRSFEPGEPANGTYPAAHPPETVPVDRARLLVAPDNAGEEVVAVIDGAEESVDVLQVSIGGPDQRFLRAAVRAARRGVDVRVLLSGAWYVRDDNERLVETLRERADAEGLPIEAKLVEPGGDFEKVHAKGVIVDGESVILGSLNWNDAATADNREVLLHLTGDEVADYYGAVFEADWRGETRDLPVGFAAAAAGLVLLAALVARRISFGEEVGVG